MKPNGSNDLAETRFEFLFILIGKSTIILLFYKANHDVYSNPGTLEGPEQGFCHCFTDGLNHSLVWSVVQAEVTVHFDYVRSINIHASLIIRVVLESFICKFPNLLNCPLESDGFL